MIDVCPAAQQKQTMDPSLESKSYPANLADPSPLSRPKKEEDLAPAPLHLAITPTTTMDIDLKAEPDLKSAMDTSPSQSPTLVAGASAHAFKLSASPPPTDNQSRSKSSTPPVAAPSKSSKKAPIAPVQLIGHLPLAGDDARKTFNEIFDNCYQYKTLGRSREALESMTCDCEYDHGADHSDKACGPYSDCINRLTQVECLPEDCRCRSHCQNQRFQRKQYASIEVVLTEKKGYGLRAEADMVKDTFIYEYVGDVVNPSSFKKRMRDYAEEGIEHFYFMMLQKDEFIDATKNGGIGRFANHSCNPNCYVAKWTIGDHVRMGIFAKRNIRKHEELTFNYNVDRYGHQAQECFCGEPNCIGYLGGKTQTDIATLDDLYLDALGITDEDELIELKGSKKKKGKKIDDPDFMPTLKPVLEAEVPKVVQAIRQTSSRKVLVKLLMRLKITEDQAALRQIMRLRGYSLMTNLLEDNSTDNELITLVLQCMSTWPLVNRNKVIDSKVHVPLESYEMHQDEKIKGLSSNLLKHWETLPIYNRIPKRTVNTDELETALAKPEDSIIQTFTGYVQLRPQNPFFLMAKKRRAEEDAKLEAEQYKLRQELANKQFLAEKAARDDSLKAIIAQANVAAEAAVVAEQEAVAAEKAKAEAAAARAAKRKERAQRKHLSASEKEALKEKRLLKLIGAVVVKCMSKYAKSIDRESFKKYAKELTQTIAEKEKKSASYKEGRLEALSDEKVTKIKKFSKDYIAKVLRKLEKSGKRPRTSSSISPSKPTPSTSTSNETSGSNSHDQDDIDMGDSTMTMSVEEAMGMDLESDDDADDEVGDVDMKTSAGTSASPSTSTVPSEPSLARHHPPHSQIAPTSMTTTDPRLRPPQGTS